MLELRRLSKHFGAVQALTDVDLKVYRGKVTALVGDNGAGKSVTLKTIAGIHPPDGGQIYWQGQPVHIRTPRDSASLGIETVYQDLALCNNLDIVQNMFLGREPTRRGLMDENSMETAAVRPYEPVGDHRAVGAPGRRFPLGRTRQAVAVAKAVMWNSKLVIMDEPTAALGVAQTAMVLALTRRLAERGLGVIFVSHNFNDVFEVADQIAVLYLGRLVASIPASAPRPPDGGGPGDNRHYPREVPGQGTSERSLTMAQRRRSRTGRWGGRPSGPCRGGGKPWAARCGRCPRAYLRSYVVRVRGATVECCPWSAACCPSPSFSR